jgi:uncharacterized protein YyaL (SSP411 family)
MPNRLATETSPYLRQHAGDPIDWHPWGGEAWSKAAASSRPVFLSIGYAGSHWCQVMSRESFSDPEVAALVNAHFVAILVDRHERPDVDGWYLEALQTLMESAGWPMNLFLTPGGELFFGGSYYPPERRGALPSFRQVLESVADEWRYRRRELEAQAADLLRQIRERPASLPGRRPLSAEGLDQGIVSVLSAADQTYGGFGGPPKFAQPWLVELMLEAATRGPGGAHGVADLTLRRMARGGIYDQIGGGFHHDAVDAAWAVPHFEKLLGDNALAARLYTHAWQARHDPLFRRIATETLEYLLGNLRAPTGAFYAGEGAESPDGTDGGSYVWDSDAFAEVAPEAAGFYGVPPAGRSIVLTAAGDDPPAAARARLAQRRATRPRPARDEQVITSWNGLAIAALAEAGAAFGRAEFLSAAEQAAAYLLGQAGEDGLLPHLAGSAPGTAPGLAEDYAFLADGLLALWEATLDPRWAEASRRLAGTLVERFRDAGGGALFSTPAAPGGGPEPVLRRHELIDASVPSPNGVAALLLQRLAALFGAAGLLDRAREILEAAQPTMRAAPTECGTLYRALAFLVHGPRVIAVSGDPGRPETAALLREVWQRFIPNRVIAAAPLRPGEAAPVAEPAVQVTGGAGARRPTSDAAELARQLRAAGLPSPERVARATELARSTLHRMWLLDQLDNPMWIDPLRERGFFRAPPGSIDHYLPGASGSPPWPDSKYLAKMASVDPFAVHRVAMQIPDTDNSLVHEDLADVALALPPDLAADFAGPAAAWLRSSVHHAGLPKKLGALVSHLAKGGFGEAALRLAAALLELQVEHPVFRGAAAEEGLAPPPQPQGRFSPWEYEEILRENLPDAVRAVPLPALDLLADLLDRAVGLSVAGDPAAGGEELLAGGIRPDGSYLWRPNIAEDLRNLDRTVRGSLVSAVRDAAEAIVRENPGMLGELVARLSTRSWAVFRRIALHLLWVFPEDAPAMADEILARPGLLDDPHLSREHLLLADQRIDELAPEARRRLLKQVEAGPDLARWDAVPDRWGVDPRDAKAAAAFARSWTASRFAYLTSEGSPGAGDPTDPTFPFPLMSPPIDLSTPKQAEWLRSAPIAGVVAFFGWWRPPPYPGAPTRDGLRRKLLEVITSEPSRFAEEAGQLAGLADGDLRAAVAGFREAARQGTAFPWPPVLDLFAAVLTRSAPGDPAGDALRMGIARTLAAGLTAGPAEIPAEARDRVWDLLAVLAAWPLPAQRAGPGPGGGPEAEPGPGGGPEAEPARTVAAEALQAVARYALWVRRQLESAAGARTVAAAGWGGMPEVREVLEGWLADPGRALTVQAAFGQWFPWLLMLDQPWAAAHRGAIFPRGQVEDGEGRAGSLRQAAWDTYLAMTPVFDQVFELLAAEYRTAVASLTPDTPLTRPQQGLAEHLMGLYLRGRVALDGPDPLLGEFFARAPQAQRAHALAYIGQMLRNQQEGRVPGEILARLQALWQHRLAEAQAAADVEAYAEELATFGHWFASGTFEAAWALRQLAALLQLTGRVAATAKVVEGLKPYMESMPLEVVQCIAALAAREWSAITILGWGQDAQQILSRIVGSSDDAARSLALDLLGTFDLQPIKELVRWG